jgi:hypothetical protein
MSDNKIRISLNDVQSTRVDDDLRRKASGASTTSPVQPWANTPTPSPTSSKLPLLAILGSGLVLVLVAVVFVAIRFVGDSPQRAEIPTQQVSDATRIESVLQQDVTTNSGTQSAADVVARMRAIDLTGCPNDFKSAYVAHIHAWELMADVQREAAAHRADSESGSAMVESLIRGFMGDPFGKANEIVTAENQLQRSYQTALQQIRATFQRVEELAVTHGANLPKAKK